MRSPRPIAPVHCGAAPIFGCGGDLKSRALSFPNVCGSYWYYTSYANVLKNISIKLVGDLLGYLVNVARAHGDDERVVPFREKPVADLVERIECDDGAAEFLRRAREDVVGNGRIGCFACGVDGSDERPVGERERGGESLQ